MATLTVPDEKLKLPVRSIFAAVTTLLARYAALSIAPSAILADTTESAARAADAMTPDPKRLALSMIPVARFDEVMVWLFICEPLIDMVMGVLLRCGVVYRL